MSKSNAHILLQKLVSGLNKNWSGKGTITSKKAYEMCKEIVKEYEEDEQQQVLVLQQDNSRGQAGLPDVRKGIDGNQEHNA